MGFVLSKTRLRTKTTRVLSIRPLAAQQIFLSKDSHTGEKSEIRGSLSISPPAGFSMEQPRTVDCYVSRRLQGLTLIELLVAVAILVTVSASSMLIFRGIGRAWRTGEIRTERYQQARLLFELFVRELSSSVANSNYPLVGNDASSESPFNAESQFDELYFVGRLPGRTGLVERGYWVSDGILMCHDDEPADGDYGTGLSELCGQGIGGFDISYFDGSEWFGQWDARPLGAQAGQLPKAVHVVLQIGRQRPEQFETIIYVPTS